MTTPCSDTATMRLYHFTCLVHMAKILREGLTCGTLAGCPLTGPNFTASPDPEVQTWRHGCCLDKVKVRMTVDVPTDRLRNQLDLWKQYGVTSRGRNYLDPRGQAKRRFLYHGRVPAQNIALVEILEGGAYRTLDGEERAELCDRIDAEARRLVTFDAGDGTTRVLEGQDSWLFDAPEWVRGRPASRSA